MNNINPLYVALIATAVVNLITFLLFGIDKSKAVRGKWRIPEATLLTFAFLGGSIGAILGMKIFRHKTKKAKFRFGCPAILILHIILIILFCKYVLLLF